MIKKHNALMIVFLLSLILISSSNGIALNSPIEILVNNRTSDSLEIMLNYDFSSTYDESLAFIATFSPYQYLSDIESSIIFIRTPEEENFLFWMIGNPFTQAQNWQQGYNLEHYSITGNTIYFQFTEYINFKDPELFVYEFAMFTSMSVDSYSNDFSEILLSILPFIPITEFTVQSSETDTTNPDTSLTTDQSQTNTESTAVESTTEIQSNQTDTTSKPSETGTETTTEIIYETTDTISPLSTNGFDFYSILIIGFSIVFFRYLKRKK